MRVKETHAQLKMGKTKGCLWVGGGLRVPLCTVLPSRGVSGLKLRRVSPHMCLRRTFSYILRELPKVPTHVPVCVLGNYRDMGEHRVILPDDVRDLIDSLNRWAPSGSLRGASQRPRWGRGAGVDPVGGREGGQDCSARGTGRGPRVQAAGFNTKQGGAGRVGEPSGDSTL